MLQFDICGNFNTGYPSLCLNEIFFKRSVVIFIAGIKIPELRAHQVAAAEPSESRGSL